MKRANLATFAIIGIVSLASLTTFDAEAQQNQNRDKDKDKERRIDRGHQSDRNMDRDQIRDRDMDRDRVSDGMNGYIFGGLEMTEQERETYRQQLKAATSEQERNQIRAQHQKQILEQRQNRPLFDDGMGGFIYGGYKMSAQERQRLRDRLKSASSEQERNQIRAEHQEKIHMQSQNKTMFDDGFGGFIYGADQMTEQARLAYRQMLKTAASEQQRNTFRMEHQERMQRRLNKQLQQSLSEKSG